MSIPSNLCCFLLRRSRKIGETNISEVTVAYAGKNFGGGVQGRGSGLVGGAGGGAPRTPENFRKNCKKFLKKIAINVVFSPILQKNFKTIR